MNGLDLLTRQSTVWLQEVDGARRQRTVTQPHVGAHAEQSRSGARARLSGINSSIAGTCATESALAGDWLHSCCLLCRALTTRLPTAVPPSSIKPAVVFKFQVLSFLLIGDW